jgi:hypothetical protein
MINFCYDQLATSTVGYPNLAKWSAEPYTTNWHQFDAHWPQTVPLRLLMYLDAAHIPYGVYTVLEAPTGSWYPVAFSWFNFTCDYFSLLSPDIRLRIIKREVKILFYYHEGDNPLHINEHLHRCQVNAQLPRDCYHLVSANTSADKILQATYFSEHEFFFRHVNRKQNSLKDPTDRTYEFTALNRTHKWWRAAVMADLLSFGILNNSLWSYNSIELTQDSYKDNPISIDIQDITWRKKMHDFVSAGPYHCDQLNDNQQNNHHYVNTDLYTNSYFQIVIETHFDADQSSGTFITEKTWKPIKFGQPFVIIGPAGTLATLRAAGYCVFDDVLDNTYDTIENNTDRYVAVRNLLLSMQRQGVADLFEKCRNDIKHNQINFEARLKSPLNILLEKLTCQI